MQEEIKQMLERANYQKVEEYLKILDRILIYNIAVSIIPSEQLDEILGLWSKILKKHVNLDAESRTSMLEGTNIGRLAKVQDVWDGEKLRLYLLDQIEIAKKIAVSNLKHKKQDEDDFSTEISN